ncbi:MAG: hypothetical protein AAGB31_04035 [Bdellovibrio sp.]
MKTTILSLILLSTAWAQADTHMFYCALTTQEPSRQVYFEIESNAVESKIGTVKIAKMSETDIGWQVVEQAKVQADITWANINGQTEITGVDINMGKSGHLSYAKNDDGGFVKANLMSLNFPDGIQFNSCMYFLSTGPKPGLTGSN